MKLFIIASMLFGGGTAAALSNEEITENIKEKLPEIVQQRFRHRMEERKENFLLNVKEDGIPYPAEEKLAELTEDQQIQILSLIDQYNAEYDFSIMTDEEIKVVLEAFQADMVILHEELGLEFQPFDKEQFRQRIYNNVRNNMQERFSNILDNIREDGFVLKEDCPLDLTEEQQLAIEAKVAEINAEYDFSSMTDEELKTTLTQIKVELDELFTELEIERPMIDRAEVHEGMRQRRGK